MPPAAARPPRQRAVAPAGIATLLLRRRALAAATVAPRRCTLLCAADAALLALLAALLAARLLPSPQGASRAAATAAAAAAGGAPHPPSLFQPTSVAVDAAGDLFVTDDGTNRTLRLAHDSRVVTIVAGGGDGGDGGPATSAWLGTPTAVALDAATGDVLISEALMGCVRRVSARTGVITTVAGNLLIGFSGDGGPATSAKLGTYIRGLTVVTGGDLLIADTVNCRIRRVAATTGVITTVAGNGKINFSGDGGPATSASLYGPSAVAVDGRGNMFIADTNHHRVRRVAAGSGVITTVAGTGTEGFSGGGVPATSAMLSLPTDVALDGGGHLFIADMNNNCVRRVSLATGAITTVAGMPLSPAGFSGDGGRATRARLSAPYAVAVDGRGNVFIADINNHRVRRVDAGSGIITTVGGLEQLPGAADMADWGGGGSGAWASTGAGAA